MPRRGSKSHVRSLYAHWLDAEWLKVAAPFTVEAPFTSLEDVLESWLKLHALFGTSIRISDIQLIGSKVLLRLFGDVEFRDYLKSDSDFLSLVAQPRQDISDTRVGIATRGLARTRQKGWTTSLPGISVETIQRFADTILSLPELDTAKVLRDGSMGPKRFIRQHPEHQDILPGMLYGICHFAKASGGPCDTPVVSPGTFWDFIEKTLNSPALSPHDSARLEKVWQSIRLLVPDEEDRLKRSCLQRAMEMQEPNRQKWSPEYHTIWNTVVHAWNSTVCDTVGATGASISPLPNAVVPYRGRIVDVAGPFEEREDSVLRQRLTSEYPIFPFDVSSLSWTAIRELVRRLQSERYRFQEALASGDKDEMIEAGGALIKPLSQGLSHHRSTIIPEGLSASLGLLAVFIPAVGILHTVDSIDHFQAWLRGRATKHAVLNTLHVVKDDLITAYSSEAQPS